MSSYVTRENLLRTNKYRKDEQAEKLFLEMNNVLAQLEQMESSGIDYPTLFIFGLPRSGTTLTYQLIAQCLGLGYVNNLIARFWLSPQHGIALSKTVLGSLGEAGFESDFGKTKEPHGPHEFAYFWQHWLNIHDTKDMLAFNCPNLEINWKSLGQTVRCMQDAFGSGIVFKTMYVANHIRTFFENFAMPFFVYIERNPVDVALSILRARLSYYGREDVWWATYPPNYRQLEKLSFDKQIAGQVRGLCNAYEQAIKCVPSDCVIRLTYEQLCKSPSGVLIRIKSKLKELYGYDLDIKMRPPKQFTCRKETVDEANELQVAVIKALS